MVGWGRCPKLLSNGEGEKKKKEGEKLLLTRMGHTGENEKRAIKDVAVFFQKSELRHS